jgi:very-short-patch-repair endonuclease
MPTGYRDERRAVEKLKPARRLRHDLTDAERRLWSRLRDRQVHGAKFRRQHEFGPYILDFYCPELSLIVEADGSQHLTGDGLLNDQVRTTYLESRGLHVLRFTNREILTETGGVMTVIEQAVLERLSRRADAATMPLGEAR